MNCKRTCRAREAQRRTEGRTGKKDNVSTKRISDKVRLLRQEIVKKLKKKQRERQKREKLDKCKGDGLPTG